MKMLILAVLCVTIVCGNMSVGAVDNTQNNSNNTTTTPVVSPTGAVCARVTTLSQSGLETINQRIVALRAAYTKQLQDIDSRKVARDQKVTMRREESRGKIDAKLETLRQSSDLTDEQKALVDEYAEAIRAAEATRTKAVDAARAAYRTELSALISTYQLKIETAVLAYKASVAGAFSAAQSTCASDPAAITTLKTSIKTAKDVLVSATSKPDEAKTTLKDLGTKRRDAVKLANQAFLKEVKEFSEDLKAKLKSADPNV